MIDDRRRQLYDHLVLKPLSGQDASVLALLAQAPKLSKAQRDGLIGSLSTADAKQIGRALIGEKASKGATAAAHEFQEWANGLNAADRAR